MNSDEEHEKILDILYLIFVDNLSDISSEKEMKMVFVRMILKERFKKIFLLKFAKYRDEKHITFASFVYCALFFKKYHTLKVKYLLLNTLLLKYDIIYLQKEKFYCTLLFTKYYTLKVKCNKTCKNM